MTPTNPKPNAKPLSEARDADARHSMAALQRAAHKAKQLAASTNTPLIVVNRTSLQTTLQLSSIV